MNNNLYKLIEHLNLYFTDEDGIVFQLVEYDKATEQVLLVSENNDTGGWKALYEFPMEQQQQIING